MPLLLLGYDIADPKRLQRIHRAVVRHATPIQHSVFLLEDAEAVSRCLAVVLPLIDPNADDVRVYPLPPQREVVRLGKPTFPEGIVWMGLPKGLR